MSKSGQLTSERNRHLQMRLNSIAAFLAGAAALLGGPAFAGGFKIHDLTTVEADVAAAFAPEFYHWAIPNTMHLSCCGNQENQIISIEIDRQTDEIGKENRADEAYISEMEDTCTNKGIPCQIEDIQAGTGIGRLMTISLGGGMKGANVILVRDGDRLTIRSAANDANTARKNAETALDALKNSLLGGD